MSPKKITVSLLSDELAQRVVKIKVQITTAADGNLIFFFRENKAWHLCESSA